jgi:hypothetical protein
MTKEDGKTIAPSNYICFDFSGLGISEQADQERVAVLSKAPRKGDLQKGIRLSNKSMKLNVKYGAAMNGEGLSMDQVWVFKHEEADGVVCVTLSKQAHDRRDIHVLFTNENLTGPEVTKYIFKNQLQDFMDEVRRGPDNDDDPCCTEPCALAADGDSSNIKAFDDSKELYKENNTRIAVFSASQSGVESDEDAGTPFRGLKKRYSITGSGRLR